MRRTNSGFHCCVQGASFKFVARNRNSSQLNQFVVQPVMQLFIIQVALFDLRFASVIYVQKYVDLTLYQLEKLRKQWRSQTGSRGTESLSYCIHLLQCHWRSLQHSQTWWWTSLLDLVEKYELCISHKYFTTLQWSRCKYCFLLYGTSCWRAPYLWKLRVVRLESLALVSSNNLHHELNLEDSDKTNWQKAAIRLPNLFSLFAQSFTHYKAHFL